jgi:hypothetical protein
VYAQPWGKCGPQHNNAKCRGTQCCSSTLPIGEGWTCGEQQHCNITAGGCMPAYGHCIVEITQISNASNTNAEAAAVG